MGKAQQPEPVLLIAGLLYHDRRVFIETLKRLEGKFGPVQHETEEIDFTFTEYYNKEMGTGLKRCFVAFEKPVDPGRLAEIKTYTNRLETKFLRDDGGRSINIDPGLVGLGNLVLASTKEYAHRLYLGDGIYGEVSLLYVDKAFVPLPWTYPDYKVAGTMEFLKRVRESLKQIIIALREEGNRPI